MRKPLTSPGAGAVVSSQGRQPWPRCLHQSCGPVWRPGAARVHDEARAPGRGPRQHSSQQVLVLRATPLGEGPSQGLTQHVTHLQTLRDPAPETVPTQAWFRNFAQSIPWAACTHWRRGSRAGWVRLDGAQEPSDLESGLSGLWPEREGTRK